MISEAMITNFVNIWVGDFATLHDDGGAVIISEAIIANFVNTGFSCMYTCRKPLPLKCNYTSVYMTIPSRNCFAKKTFYTF